MDKFLILCELINDINFSKGKLEENIIAIRGLGNSNIIKTKFPWKEDERMIRVLIHLIGDGYGGSEVGGNGLPFYRNYAPELLDEFQKDLNVFGEVPYNRRETLVQFPKVVTYILRHLYNIKFDTYNSSIPNILLN